MRRVHKVGALAGLLLGLGATVFAADQADGREGLGFRIRPVLAKRCFAGDASTDVGGLEMTGGDALLKGGARGVAILTDKPAESLVLRAVKYDFDALKMPPGGKMPEEEIRDITAWVKAGAVWPDGGPAAPKGPAFKITADQRAFW